MLTHDDQDARQDWLKEEAMSRDLLSGLIGRDEIRVAVDWWAKVLLARPTQDAGDPTGRIEMFAEWGRNQRDVPSPRHIERFRRALTALAACLCAETWDEDDPQRGSSCRVIATDYGPDNTLSCALKYAYIDGGDLLLPIKTCMWINPGNVTVRPGYSGREVTVFPERDPEHHRRALYQGSV